ncbi:MAG TPA: response regulator transcription factor [Halanaerobiales bacterium]|nr:response regulator transcription factor [Halanaerobiales bacterium]
MPNKLLIVDDEKNIRDLIKYNLEQVGYEILEATNGIEALNIVNKDVDLVILDLMIPEIDGLEVCKRIRSKKALKDIGIIMLTAKDEELDRILGLEIGADDYMTKPFSIRELRSRIKAVLRRTKKDFKAKDNKKLDQEEYMLGDLEFNIPGYEVKKAGKDLDLTPKEFELLKFMFVNKNKVLTRNILLEKIWGYEYTGDTRTVDVHIRRLRKKIGKRYIKTIRGMGYKLINSGK